MTNKPLIKLTILGAALALPTAASARTSVYGQAYDSATGVPIPNTFDVYEVFGVNDQGGTNTAAQNWNTSEVNAALTTDPIGGSGAQGHLASSTNSALNSWLHQLGGRTNLWIGGTDNETYGGTEAGSDGVNAGWVWTNGDTVPFSTYQNWGGGEPNNSGGEDAAHIRGDRAWNDQKSDAPGGTAGGPSYRAAVHYRANIDINNLNAFKVTTYKAAPSVPIAVPQVNNFARVDELINDTPGSGYGGRTAVVGSAPVGSVGGGTPAHFGAANVTAYPGSPTPANADESTNDFVMAGRGQLTVGAADAGDFTFGISGDDGGYFYIDLNNDNDFADLNENVVVDDALHGNVDKFGVVNLAAGTYDFEWVGFERGGGDGWEAFYKQGAVTITPNGTAPPAGGVEQSVNNTNVTNLNGWYVLGDTQAGTSITITEPGAGPAGMQVTMYKQLGTESTVAKDVNDLAAALDVIANASDRTTGYGDSDDGVFTVYTPTVDISDSAVNGNFGSSQADQDALPGYVGSDQDDYVVVAEGFVSLTAGDWTLGGNSDDGQRIRIDLNGDGDFDDTGESAELGCCTNLFHNINVGADGRYQVEYLFWENSGGAAGELFAATGHTTDLGQFNLVGGAGGPAVWQVIPEPSTGVLGLFGLLVLATRRRRR